MKRKLKGFTLVELVITIAIVIILSVVSVPIYQGYTRKAKMAEGYALLGLLLSAQKNYFSEYGKFLDDNFSSSGNNHWTCNEEVLGVDARGNKYFTLFNVNPNNAYVNTLFTASVLKPKDLIDNENSILKIVYNITSGATILERPDMNYID